MDINDLHPPDDPSTRYFIWHEWINAHGPLINEEVAFNYFASSTLYDKQCNNQVLRMQTMHTGVPIANEAEELRRFTGIEFAVVHAQPPTFFIIHKRERTSPDHTTTLTAYFITNNRIYVAPDLYSILSTRLLTSVSSLQTTLDTLRKHKPDYTPRTGFVWPIVGQPDPSEGALTAKKGLKDKGKSRAQTEEPSASLSLDTTQSAPSQLTQETQGPAATQESLTKNPNAAASASAVQETPTLTGQKHQNTMLLLNAMRTTAMHSKISLPGGLALSAPGGAIGGTIGADTGSMTVDTPTTTTGGQIGSSATPVPTGQETMIKGVNPNAPPESGKVKKKKKRTSVAVPTPTAGPS